MVQAISNLPLVRRHNGVLTFVISTWIGWLVETNWTNAVGLVFYLFARPIASVLILVVMYSVITNGATGEAIFAYIYLGNALYLLVGNVVGGVSTAVVEDREHYRVTKQIHTAPIDGYAYLLGRGAAKLFIGAISVVITIVFGVIAFGLPISLAGIDWGLFLVSTLFGLASTGALGLMIGAVNLIIPRHLGAVGEAVAGALYLFSGAIFPLDVLPAWMQPIGYVFPVTYWLEAARRALLGEHAARFPTLSGFTDWQLVGILVLSTLVLVVASIFVYRRALYEAKERGMLDMDTSY